MTAEIVNLKQWEAEHPPLLRLVHISRHLICAAAAMQYNAWRVWWSIFVIR